MKKTLLFIVAAASFLITSCEKKRCYDCETTVYKTSPNTSTFISSNTKAICDATEDDIIEVEESGSYQNRIDTFVTVTRTKCKY